MRAVCNLMRRVRSLASLGVGVRGRAQVYWAGLCLPIVSLLPARMRWTVTVHVRVADQPVSLSLGDRSELNVLEEVVINEEYGAVRGLAARTVLDLGANIGVSALYFRALFPTARLVAVEPNPVTFRRLTANLSPSTDVACLCAALTAQSGPVRFDDSQRSWMARIDASGSHTREVLGLSFGDICERTGLTTIDLVKIDIEGTEWDALPCADLSGVGYVIGEIHDRPGADPEMFLHDIVAANGFAGYKLVGHLFTLFR